MCSVYCVPEHSLRHSKHQQLHSVLSRHDDGNVNVDEVVRNIAAIKKVDVSACPV